MRVFVFAILIAGIFAQQECALDKNVGLKYLVSLGVTANAAPDKSAEYESICGDEFKNHGCCCNKGSVTKLINENTGKIKAKWESYLDKLRFATKYIEQLKNVFTRVADIRAKMAVLANNEKTSGKDLVSNLDEKTLEALKKFTEDFKAQFDKIKEAGSTCWAALTKFRSNSLCAICSGRSAKFLNAVNPEVFSLNLSEGTVKNVVTGCLDYWKFNFNYLRIGDLMEYFEKAVKGGAIDYSERKVISASENGKIVDALKVCRVVKETVEGKETSVLKDCPIEQLKTIGENFISIFRENPNSEGSNATGKAMEGKDFVKTATDKSEADGVVREGNVRRFEEKREELRKILENLRESLRRDEEAAIKAANDERLHNENLAKENAALNAETDLTKKIAIQARIASMTAQVAAFKAALEAANLAKATRLASITVADNQIKSHETTNPVTITKLLQASATTPSVDSIRLSTDPTTTANIPDVSNIEAKSEAPMSTLDKPLPNNAIIAGVSMILALFAFAL
jgi:hypothetical protein